jgi:hypothetical protein
MGVGRAAHHRPGRETLRGGVDGYWSSVRRWSLGGRPRRRGRPTWSPRARGFRGSADGWPRALQKHIRLDI